MFFVSVPFNLTSFVYILTYLGKKIVFLISIFSRFFTKSQGFLEKNYKISGFCMNQTWQV